MTTVARTPGRRVAIMATAALAGFVLAACGSLPPMAPAPPPSQPRPQTGPGSTQTQPRPPTEQLPPEGRERPPPKEFHLGAAALSLVSQAHKQSQGGDPAGAAATLERALRIEPNNPLLWIELGDVRLSENDFEQAHSMGRKALALATGDPRAQSSSWTLIAESLRRLHRNSEAAEADQKAAQALAR